MKKQLVLLLSLLVLAGCGTTHTTSPGNEIPDHQGPASYYDPQAVDLTKDPNLGVNELSDDFYNPNKWVGMDNDHYSPAEVQSDTSMKFRNTNAAFDMGDYSNKSLSFTVKGNNDWNIYLLANNKSNNSNNFIRVECQYNVLRIKTSFSGNSAVAYVPAGYNFKMNEFSRLDFKFETANSTTTMKMWVDEVPVVLKKATDFSSKGVSISNGNLVVKQSSSFTLGNYFIVKIWDDQDYLFIKKVS